MTRLIAILAGAFALASVGGTATAQENPYPSPRLPLFVAGQTVTEEGALTNFFIRGQTVVFRAYAGQTKTRKYLTPKDLASFYVQIPGQPNLKLTYRAQGPAGPSGRWRWTARWVVPADYPFGVVNFKILLKTKSNQRAAYVQIPVASSQLTVTTSVDAGFLQEATAAASAAPSSLDVFLYADTVNGTRPAGAKPRPVGCTQTTTFKRGEQLVFRIWGTEAADGAILSTENVKYAYVKIPGQPFAGLNWGPHGPASNRVWFWTAAWQVPTDFPLGTVTFRIVFKTESNKFGMYDHVVNVIP